MKAGQITRTTKFMLAKKVFAHTAAYDGMITNYLTSLEAGSEFKTEAVPAGRVPRRLQPATAQGARHALRREPPPVGCVLP